MKLSPQQLRQTFSKLQFWQDEDTPCSLCGAKDWAMADRVFELREFHGKNSAPAVGSAMAVIAISCTNCGNTHLLNAVALGFVPKMDT